MLSRCSQSFVLSHRMHFPYSIYLATVILTWSKPRGVFLHNRIRQSWNFADLEWHSELEDTKVTVKEYFHLAGCLDFSLPRFLGVYSFTGGRAHRWGTQVGSLSAPEKHLCVSRIQLHLIHCILTSCLPPLFSWQNNLNTSCFLFTFIF